MDAEVLKAVAELAWPALAAIILLALLPTIVKVLRSRGVTIKYGDMELTVQDASDQLRKQVDDIQNQLRDLIAGGVVAAPPTSAKKVLEPEEATAPPTHRLILWVDDKPINNAYEIAKLQSDGYSVSTAESTAAALTLLQSSTVRPDAIISDMGRREGLGFNRTAGIDLIRSIRAQGMNMPVYIYSTADGARQYADQVHEAGGNGITHSPLALFELVETGASGKSR